MSLQLEIVPKCITFVNNEEHNFLVGLLLSSIIKNNKYYEYYFIHCLFF